MTYVLVGCHNDMVGGHIDGVRCHSNIFGSHMDGDEAHNTTFGMPYGRVCGS